MEARKVAIIADPYLAEQSRIISLLQPDFTCIRSGSLRETWWTTREKVQQLDAGQQPLLLLLELDQPDGDGIDFIRHAQTDPVLHSILIACVTYRSSLSDKLAALRMGADAYWVKPDLPQNFAAKMVLLHQTGYMARAAKISAPFGWHGTPTAPL